MSLTYSTLQDDIGNILSDSTYSSTGTNATLTERCIAKFESEANTILKGFTATVEMETRATASASSQYLAVPTNFGGVRTFQVSTDPASPPLRYLTPDGFDSVYANSATGQPVAYTIIGSEFKLGPSPDTTYTMALTYWLGIPALSDSNTTNWLLTNYEHIYTAGVLKYLYGLYLGDPENKSQIYHLAMMDGLDKLISADKRAKYGAAPQTLTDVGVV